ncbi:MAG: hypothetical protein AB1449_06100 [Chloroflexota bacterium]
MSDVRIHPSLRIILAAGLVVAVVTLAGNALGWVGSASAQTVPTSPPPTSTLPPPPPTRTPTTAATATPTVTSTAPPTETMPPAPTATPLPTETEVPLPPSPTTAPAPPPSRLPIPGWCIGGIALAIVALLVVMWLISRRRPKG